MTYQIWRPPTILINPSILVKFDHSHQASKDYILTMKEFDCIMSGKFDNPSPSIDSYLSDDNDEPDLQRALIEELRQRRLNRIRLMRLKQAQQKNRRKTKNVSITALLKQINHDCQAVINDVVVIDLVEPKSQLWYVSVMLLFLYFSSNHLTIRFNLLNFI